MCPRSGHAADRIAVRSTASRDLPLALALVVACLGSVQAQGPSAVVTGTVVRVFDGDSLQLRTGGDTVDIRLYGVDAPERNQTDADAARRALSGMILRKRVEVEVIDVDQYGRYVAIVRRDDALINEAMLRAGHAWAFRAYLGRLAGDARYCELDCTIIPAKPPWIAGRRYALRPPIGARLRRRPGPARKVAGSRATSTHPAITSITSRAAGVTPRRVSTNRKASAGSVRNAKRARRAGAQKKMGTDLFSKMGTDLFSGDR
jgi:endonuclease YncB( thermonuclease family)